METRRYWIIPDIAWLPQPAQGEKWRTVGMVESVREIQGQVSVERRLASLSKGIHNSAALAVDFIPTHIPSANGKMARSSRSALRSG